MKLNKDSKKVWIDYFPLTVTAIALIVLGIIFEQKFIKLCPTLISLVVMLLSAHANRFAFLLGGCNSLLYSIGYIMEKLYPSALSAILISFPFQIASFILWSKNQTKDKEVRVKKMNKKAAIITSILSVASWIIFYFIYERLGTSNLILDNTTFVLGIITTVLSMLRYKEFVYLSAINLIIDTIKWGIITIGNIANITYLIYSFYALYRQIQATYTWETLYKTQNNVTLK